VALGLWLAMSWGLRLYVGRFADYNATYGSIGGIVLLMLWLYLTGVVLLVGAEINAEIEHAAARRGALTAKAPGEQRAPADEEPEGGAWPLPGRALTEDVAVAGRVIERWVAEARRRGWAPIALLGGGVLVGWLLRGRSPSAVARTGGRIVWTTAQIAAAIALHHPEQLGDPYLLCQLGGTPRGLSGVYRGTLVPARRGPPLSAGAVSLWLLVREFSEERSEIRFGPVRPRSPGRRSRKRDGDTGGWAGSNRGALARSPCAR